MQWDDINWETTPYSSTKAYSQSKLANVLFSAELATRLEGSGITVYCLHPGVINTDLGRHVKETYGALGGVLLSLAKPLIKTVASGAQTSIYCAVDESISGVSGRYYSDCAEKRPKPQGESVEDAKRLWQVSERLTGLKL